MVKFCGTDGRVDMSDLASKAGLVEGLASSPHHLRNEHSLFTPVIIYIQVGFAVQCSGNIAHAKWLPD